MRETKWKKHERSFSTLLPLSHHQASGEEKRRKQIAWKELFYTIGLFYPLALGKGHERTCTYVSGYRSMDIYMYVRGRDIVNIYTKYRENKTFIFFSDDTNITYIYSRAKSAFWHSLYSLSTEIALRQFLLSFSKTKKILRATLLI